MKDYVYNRYLYYILMIQATVVQRRPHVYPSSFMTVWYSKILKRSSTDSGKFTDRSKMMRNNHGIWITTWQNQQNVCAPSEDSNQPGHPPSLIRVFAVRMKKAWVLSYPLGAQRTAKTLTRLGGCPGWSESSLGAHTFCWFCHIVAHMYETYKQTTREKTSWHFPKRGDNNFWTRLLIAIHNKCQTRTN